MLRGSFWHRLRTNRMIVAMLVTSPLLSCSDGQRLFGQGRSSSEAQNTEPEQTSLKTESPAPSESSESLGDQVKWESLSAQSSDSAEATAPPPGGEDRPVLIPQNVAGAFLFDCGILTDNSGSTPGHLVCASQRGRIVGAHLLDSNRDLLRDNFLEFALLGTEQLIATRLPTEPFKFGAKIRITVDLGATKETGERELFGLPSFPFDEVRTELKSILDESGKLNALSNMSLNPECQGTLVESAMQFEVTKKDSGSCFWDATIGDRDLEEGQFSASVETSGSVQLSSMASVCRAHISINQPNFYYNDDFAIMVQNRIIAASFGKSWSFEHSKAGFPLYRKTDVMGRSTDGDGSSDHSCFGIDPPIVCQIPNEMTDTIPLHIEMDIPLGEMRLASQSVDWSFAIFGDNDDDSVNLSGFGSEIDCRHSGLKADLKVWRAQQPIGTNSKDATDINLSPF